MKQLCVLSAHDIPVSILDHHGECQAVVSSIHYGEASLSLLLERASATPEGVEGVRGWFSAREREHALRGVNGLQVGCAESFHAEDVIRLIGSNQKLGRKTAMAVRAMWRGYLLAMVAELLNSKGITCELRHARGNQWYPLRWMVDLLRWDLEIHLCEVSQWSSFRILKQAPTSALAVKAFAEREPRLRKLAEEELKMLQCWLATHAGWA